MSPLPNSFFSLTVDASYHPLRSFVHCDCRREKTLSFEIGGEEETESMNSSAAKAAEPNPPERLEEFQSPVDTVLEGLYRKVGKPEVKRPSNIEIEEFFAAAEADNLLDLNHFKNK